MKLYDVQSVPIFWATLYNKQKRTTNADVIRSLVMQPKASGSHRHTLTVLPGTIGTYNFRCRFSLRTWL